MPASVAAPRGPDRTTASTAASSASLLRAAASTELIMIGLQSRGAQRSSFACLAVTGVPRFPQDVRMYVTTAAISLSESDCANGGIPYGIGLPAVPGG